jgi:hypothetical protein
VEWAMKQSNEEILFSLTVNPITNSDTIKALAENENHLIADAARLHINNFYTEFDKCDAIAFPEEPSVRYATTTGLTVRATDAKQAYNAFNWLSDRATALLFRELCNHLL